MKIDAHHHFWKYTPEEYDWIDTGMAAIRRDFLPADLRPEIQAAGIDAVITVQARQTVEETGWLLEMAATQDFIAGVVGWLPLADPGFPGMLEDHARHAVLRGLRHVVQAEADGFLLGTPFNRGISSLLRHGLIYDLLIVERQLPESIAFVDRHPNQIFVLDHIAKPRIASAEIEPWRSNIRELARRDNVHCKLSGMVTEAGWGDWQPAHLRPYFEVVLEAFGPDRLMFGSDWPVALVACGYGRWHEVVASFIAGLSAPEQAAIMGNTAAKVYDLAAPQAHVPRHNSQT